MNQNLKKNKGITLISLIVTIIVLIILAGVSINIILGQDGIINKAKEAKENMEYAQIEEQEQLNEVYEYLELGTIGVDSSNDKVQEIASKYQILKNEYDTLQENYNNQNTEYTNFKIAIANAITEMGVETLETANTSTMADNIRSISGKGFKNMFFYQFGGSNLVEWFQLNFEDGSLQTSGNSTGSTTEYTISDFVYTSSLHSAAIISNLGGKYIFLKDLNMTGESNWDKLSYNEIEVSAGEYICSKLSGNNNFRFWIFELID